ncbi:Cell wall protein PRY3 [Daldinia childiae]|uniref:Cell wall protein PRY3 n=1 Tax=Daldinia childiae TaxID=326645 RepID=UPI0014486A6A|nr:Cell wall protein PRY3 [Daldinia childiae]KAF3062404.1 Cell wall protein PRY3 [Daldinia childiae]
MKSSVLIAAGAATLAMSSPLEKEKRAIETQWVVDYLTVTVTGTETAKPTFFWGGPKQRPAETNSPVPVVTETPEAPAPAPAPETTAPSVVIVTETQAYPTSESTPAPVVQDPAPAPSPEPSSAAPQPSPEPAATDFAGAAVQHHNFHRSNHSSPELSWSDKLAGYAYQTSLSCKMVHDMDQGDKGYGQNLANWAQSVDAYKLGDTGAVKMAVSDMWYNGEFNNFLPAYYGEDSPDMSFFESWGHMSQLVWKESTEVGCSSHYCEKGTMYDDFDAWFTVCNYSPPGNVGGAYGSNVLKPLGKSTVTA